MAIESAQAFYSKITTDEALRTQFQQAATQAECNSILQANGYQFTQEEWATVIAQNQTTSADSELSDAELTTVSGGTAGMPEELPVGPAVPALPSTEDPYQVLKEVAEGSRAVPGFEPPVP